MSINHVNEREKKNPNDIDKVPVQTQELDWRIVVLECVPNSGADCEESDYYDANGDMQRMDAGHKPIDIEKQFRVFRIGRLNLKRAPRKKMLMNFLRILEAFKNKKESA